MITTHPKRGIILALAAAASYALVPNFARFAFLAGVPALETVLVRTLVVVVVLGLAALLLGYRLVLRRAAWPSFALQCLATLVVSTCYIGSLQYISVGLSVLIFYTFPILVVLAAPVVEGRRPSVYAIGLAVLAFLGLAIAIGPSFSQLNPLGLILAAAGAVGCATQSFSGRMVSQHADPTVFGALVHLAMVPAVVGLVTVTGDGGFHLTQGLSLATLLAVLLVGLSYCAGYFLQMSAVKAAPTSTVIPFFNLEPVMTTAIAFLLLGETLTMQHLTGAAMVVVALLATSFLAYRDAKS